MMFKLSDFTDNVELLFDDPEQSEPVGWCLTIQILNVFG